MATVKARRDGENIDLEIGQPSKARTWEERAIELAQMFPEMRKQESALTKVKYDSVLNHYLDEFRRALLESMMGDIDIPVWMYSRLEKHIDHCKPLRHVPEKRKHPQH